MSNKERRGQDKKLRDEFDSLGLYSVWAPKDRESGFSSKYRIVDGYKDPNYGRLPRPTSPYKDDRKTDRKTHKKPKTQSYVNYHEGTSIFLILGYIVCLLVSMVIVGAVIVLLFLAIVT